MVVENLKKSHLAIMAGIDSDEVLVFANSVEWQ
jgi:hypothetical protein